MRRTVIDMETGEIYENIQFSTQEDRERYKKYLEIQNQAELKKEEIKEKYKEYGNFVWLLYKVNEALEWGVSPTTLTRLIYISTYMNYKNQLVFSNNNPITKKDLVSILGVYERSVEKFLSEVSAAKILIYQDGCYCLNTDVFSKGAISGSINSNYIRLYVDGIRTLYSVATPREHKSLSYLFQAIPFVNINYNMICYNPTEKNLDDVRPMTMFDYCNIIGYDYTNRHKFKNMMKKILIDGKYAFSFVENGSGLYCYINPKIYYAGNKWEDVKVLGAFDKKKE